MLREFMPRGRHRAALVVSLSLLVLLFTFPNRTAAASSSEIGIAAPAEELLLVGELIASARACVVTEVAAVVRTVDVRVGDRVKAGDVLATVDEREFTIAAAAAEAAERLAEARLRAAETGARAGEREIARATFAAADSDATVTQTEFDRFTNLHRAGGVDRRSLDRARAARDAAAARMRSARESEALVIDGPREEERAALRASLDIAHASLAAARLRVAKSKILAPWDGVVAERLVDPGAYVQVGGGGGSGSSGGIVTLVADDPLHLLVWVPERYMRLFAKGQALDFRVAAGSGRAFSGRVARIHPEIDPSTRNGLVELTVENATRELAPGMLASLTVVLRRDRADAAPSIASPAGRE